VKLSNQFLDRAISSGIPVVAFNIPDSRPQDQRIRYLHLWWGEMNISPALKLGEHVVELVNGREKFQKPTKVMCANHDPTPPGPEGALPGDGRML